MVPNSHCFGHYNGLLKPHWSQCTIIYRWRTVHIYVLLISGVVGIHAGYGNREFQFVASLLCFSYENPRASRGIALD